MLGAFLGAKRLESYDVNMPISTKRTRGTYGGIPERLLKKGRRMPRSRGLRGQSTSKSYIARIAQQVVNRNVEWKLWDSNPNATIPDTGTVTCLSLVPQGDAVNSRDGDHLRATSVSMNLICAANAFTNATQVVTCVMFQWDDDSSNSPPTVAGTFESTHPLSHLQHNFANKRMKLLGKWSYVLDASNSIQVTHAKMKIPQQQIQYLAGTTQHSKGIWFVALSNVAAANNPPTVNAYCRLNFSDA